MKLSDYLAAERGRVTALAAALGVSRPYVSMMANGVRTVSPPIAVRIELATGGAVRRQDLRPDWRDIWPELDGAATAAPAAEAA